VPQPQARVHVSLFYCAIDRGDEKRQQTALAAMDGDSRIFGVY
jgi:hypothetical protein